MKSLIAIAVLVTLGCSSFATPKPVLKPHKSNQIVVTEETAYRKIARALNEGEIGLGSCCGEVNYVAPPRIIDALMTDRGQVEVWVYPHIFGAALYLYFRDGKLVSVRDTGKAVIGVVTK